MSEEMNLKAIHQLQEYCQQANRKIGELNKQLKQARTEVIEEVKELFTDMWDSTFLTRTQILQRLTKLSEVEK